MSLINTQFAPYRLTCEQTASRPTPVYFGQEFQHININDTANVYVNTTKVPNLELGGTGSLFPYERWTFNFSPLTCQTHNCSGSIPCSAWERPFPVNSYSASLDASGSNVTESFAICHKTGFKNVMAKKLPQGWRAFNDLESTNAPNTVTGCGTDPITDVSYRTYQTSSSRTRYLTIAMSSDWTHTDYDDSSNDLAESVTVTEHINSGSGLYSFSGFSSTGGNLHAIGNIGIAIQGFSSIVSSMCTGVVPAFAGSTRTWSGGTITLTHDLIGYTIESETYDIAAGTFSRTINLRDSSGFVLPTLQESYTVSGTSLSYTSTESNYDSPAVSGSSSTLAQTDVITITATLSDPYTDGDVYSECIDMLDNWDLSDDVQMPWRTDGKPNIAPLVAYDEQLTNNFTTNFSVANFGNPIANHDGTTYPDIGWVGTCGLALAQDSSTGTTTIAMDFPGVSPGDTFSGNVGIPFNYAYTSSAVVTYTVVGGGFPTGVTFNTSTGDYSGTATDYGHWGITIGVSIGIPSFTGELIGAPLPAGYQNNFQFGFIDIRGCCDRDDFGDVSWDLYQIGWGISLDNFNSIAGVQLPSNTTNWNNFWESINKPDGAFIFYADKANYFPGGCVSSTGISGVGDGGYLVCCKYAVILDDWNSQNFYRPAGKDKFIYSELINNVFMISGSATTSSVYLVDLTNHNPVPDGTDFSGIWGGPAVGGFYDTTYGSGIATLGTKRFDVPSDWQSASGDETLCFGKLRFSEYPSLLGRQLATLSASNSHSIFTWATGQTCFGLNVVNPTESIDVWNLNMTLLSGSIPAVRMDDNTFSSSVRLIDTVKNVYITIHGASGSWYMNDNSPKGDYIMLEWLSDFRSIGEQSRLTGSVDCGGSQITLPTTNAGGGNINNMFAYFSQSQDCLPVVACSPKVIAISPNGEIFPNGHTYPFPTDFVMDDLYGQKWWKWPQTIMTDLLWEQPHRKAGIGTCAPWKNDNYGCNTDVETPCPGDEDYTGEEPPPMYFFASAPQVEARVSVPCNYGLSQNECAPDMPSGVQIGWLNPVFYPYGSGSVAFPPAPAGVSQAGAIPNGASLASQIHGAICGIMAGGGCRFVYITAGC